MSRLSPSLTERCAAILPVDGEAVRALQSELDRKTKPVRSLGRLEDLAVMLTAIRGKRDPLPLDKRIVVMGADHGVAEEGVSAYPQAVTAQMLLNFARGGAAINALARQVGAQVLVVDMGVREPLPAHANLRSRRIGSGTANFALGPAMTREQASAALEVGFELATELAADGANLLGIGEMGIGNTTSASALAAVFTGAPIEEVTGRGTGIDDATLRHKIAVIRRALQLNRPDRNDPLDVLHKLGGFELAGLCGVVLGAAAARVPVVIDGFISSTAALCAVRLAPQCAGYLVAAHRSVESGHRLVLQAIGQRPLLDLDLRLGEGTGAALAMNLCEAALRVLAEMATFEAAGVSERASDRERDPERERKT
ncbi:MAG TPA: nicotinate-nucleotide--dimethylbenzimidazole phosphoribosyltransferase [Polyangiales bacterium]|nr:nicotinate-nucleotide--dimethylbenzimidazole phosphoribosyltransferase [Polyangiales bacterium]